MRGEGNTQSVLEEQELWQPDKKSWMRGRFVNKLALWNLCFTDREQCADFGNRKGTIVPFSKMPVLSRVRSEISNLFGTKTVILNAELNVYYDIKKCGIGFHGDAERNITIGIRIGEPIPFEYQWF